MEGEGPSIGEEGRKNAVLLRTVSPKWVAWWVLCCGLGVTAAVAWKLHGWAVESDEAKFDGMVKQWIETLETRMEKYEAGMQVLQMYFHGGLIQKEPEWQFVLDLMKIGVNFPGLVEVGYGHLLKDSWNNEGPGAVLKRRHNTGPMPAGLDDAGKEIQARRIPVLFHHYTGGLPLAEYGMEMHPEDVAREYATQAQKSGGLHVSNRKDLPVDSEGRQRHGVTFYMPVYDFGRMGEAWKLNMGNKSWHRDEHARGFVFFSIDMSAFLKSLQGDEKPEVDFEIFSSAEPAGDQWLNPVPGKQAVALRRDKGVYLGKPVKMSWYTSPWTLYFYTTELFEERSTRYRAGLAGMGGTVLSLGLFGVLLWQARVREKESAAAAELASKNEQLRERAEERTRLSRDLHDGAIQSVFGLGLSLDYCLRQVEKDTPKAIKELCRSKDELNEVIAELRKMVLVLQSTETWRGQPQEAWNKMLEHLQHTSPIPLRLKIEEGLAASLTAETNIHLMNIAREATMNAIRHSRASEITVELRNGGDELKLEVRDDGCGFDAEKDLAPGHGLSNIEGRTREMGGKFSCVSAEGRGTRICVEVASRGVEARE